MKNRYTILIPISFLVTELFELAPSGIYREWFLLSGPVYPEGYGELTGTPSVSLQHYIHDIGEHLQVILLLCWIILNLNEGWFKFLMRIYLGLHILSLGNYLLNYNQPIIGSWDTNYIIGGIMGIVIGVIVYLWLRTSLKS